MYITSLKIGFINDSYSLDGNNVKGKEFINQGIRILFM